MRQAVELAHKVFFLVSPWDILCTFPAVPLREIIGKIGNIPLFPSKFLEIVLHFYDSRGKITLRHNFIIQHLCISVRFYFGKNACSISHTCAKCEEIVSQQSELCVFQCVASAAHFFVRENRFAR